MRISTGLVNAQYKVTRTSYIEFTCTNCKKNELQKISFTSVADGTYHQLQSQQSQKNVKDKAVNAASKKLNVLDDALLIDINEKRKYDKLPHKIVCPDCNTTQIWSTIPRHWKSKKWFPFWAFFQVLTLIIAAMFSSVPDLRPASITFIVFASMLLAFHLIWVIVRKSKAKSVENADFLPPKYYNRTNIEELKVRINAGIV